MKKIILGAMLAASVIQAKAQFVQNFDAGTTLPAGWAVINQGDENAWGISSAIVNGTHSGTNAAAIYYDYAENHDDYLITQAITVAAGVNDRISFWVKSRSATYLEPYEVRLSTTNNSSAAAFSVVLQPEEEALAEWTKKEFDLSNYVGQTVYVAVRATGVNEYELYVDDVVSDPLPTCANTTNLVAGNTTPTSVTISWAAGDATAWQYAIGPVSASDPSGLTFIDTDENPAIIYNLDANTAYKVWVRRDCGQGEYGDWSLPATFTTPCNAEAAPTVLQSFEGQTGTAIADCWNTQLISGTNNWEGFTPDGTGEVPNAASGTRAVRKGYNTSSALLISQPMDFANVTQPTRISVALNRHASAAATDRYEISLNTTPSLTGATQVFVQNSVTSATPAVSATGFYTYKIDIPASFNGEPVVYVLINGITESGWSSYSLGVDDFVVENTPSCAEVSAVAVSGITSEAATFTWPASVSAPANGYTYAYSTSNASADNAQYTGTTEAGVLTADVDGLTPSTVYYVWVKAECSDEESSPWSNVASFETSCAPVAALPWNEGFENIASVGSGVFPSCWSQNDEGGWRSANANTSTYDADARTGSQFVSVGYGNSEATIWTPGFELTAGTAYDFSFWFADYEGYETWAVDVLVNSDQADAGATVLGDALLEDGTLAPTAYTQAIRTFTPEQSGVYYFGIRATETAYEAWNLSFDDFEVKTSTMSAADFTASQLSFYPNPVKNKLNLSMNAAITSASVFNMLGQEVAVQKGNANDMSIDMSGLSAGIYIVKATSGSAVKSIRVIKE